MSWDWIVIPFRSLWKATAACFRFLTRKASLITVLIALLLSPLLYYGSYRLYRVADQMRFPQVSDEVEAMSSGWDEPKKGSALLNSITLQLRREMDSTFGWSVNDILPTRYLDRRGNRQLGVIFTTRMLMQFYSTELAKYGRVDNEYEDLKLARTQNFAYTEYKWWFVSTETRYRQGFNLVDKYREALESSDGAVYNMRTDDIYNLLNFIVGPQVIDQPLGRLIQSNDQVPLHELDDRVYYAQGVVLVLRDFLHALVQMYPEIIAKGGQQNIQEAFRSMDRICTFDPLIVLRGDRDALTADHRGKVARYLINVRERINDVAQSIRR